MVSPTGGPDGADFTLGVDYQRTLWRGRFRPTWRELFNKWLRERGGRRRGLMRGVAEDGGAKFREDYGGKIEDVWGSVSLSGGVSGEVGLRWRRCAVPVIIADCGLCV